MAKATNQDIIRGIKDYFVLPMIFLAVTSTLHGHFSSNIQIINATNDDICTSTDTLNSSCAMKSLLENENHIGEELIMWVVSSRILLLGFPTQQALGHQIFESIFGAVCWGICFLLIRKGFNPESKEGYFRNFWRGTVLAQLSIFNGSMLRAIIKGSIFPLERFCICLKAVAPYLSARLWPLIEENDEHFICTALYNACVIGFCWGIGNTCVRRRIDPAKLYPRETFIQRNWKDVTCGILQVGTSSLIKACWLHHTHIELVEVKLASVFALVSSYIPYAAKPSLILYTLIFGVGNAELLYHHLYESIRIGILWGFTSMFIRRGLNPELRDGGRFVRKYWRDVLYGSFSLGCCFFLKLAARSWLERIALYLSNQPETLGRDEL